MGLSAASIVGLEGPLGHNDYDSPFKRNDKTKRQFGLCQETTRVFTPTSIFTLRATCKTLREVLGE